MGDNLALQSWRWWATELQSAWADCQKILAEKNDEAIYLSVDDGIPQLLRVSEKNLVPVDRDNIGTAGFGGKRYVLGLLESKQAVVRKIRLPRSARNDLRSVLQYQISTYTPFSANDVVYDGVVTSEVAGSNTIDVRLIVVPKTVVEALSAHARMLGLYLSELHIKREVTDGEVEPLRVALQNKVAPTTKRTRSLALIALTLIAVSPIVAMWRDEAHYQQLVQEMDALKPSIAKAQVVSDERARFLGVQTTFAQIVARSVPALEILEELSAALTDDSSLVELRLQKSEVALTGLSHSAANVLTVIEGSSKFSDAKFSAPIMRQPEDSFERFSMTASWSRGIE